MYKTVKLLSPEDAEVVAGKQGLVAQSTGVHLEYSETLASISS